MYPDLHAMFKGFEFSVALRRAVCKKMRPQLIRKGEMFEISGYYMQSLIYIESGLPAKICEEGCCGLYANETRIYTHGAGMKLYGIRDSVIWMLRGTDKAELKNAHPGFRKFLDTVRQEEMRRAGLLANLMSYPEEKRKELFPIQFPALAQQAPPRAVQMLLGRYDVSVLS